MSKILRAMTRDGSARAYVINSTDIVNKAISYHKTAPTATALLGRLLTASSMMGTMLPEDGCTLTVAIRGNGIAGTTLCTADYWGNVKGYIQNPMADAPLKSNGKLDVSGIVGGGILSVSKDVGDEVPFNGNIELVSGEVAEDITSYFATSEQLPSVCALGVLVNPDLSIQAAGGFIIQLLPTALDDTIDQVEECIKGIPSVTKMLTDGMTPEEICRSVLKTFNLEILDTSKPEYRCNCSRERVTKALLTMGREDLIDMAEKDPFTEVDCHFCEKKYRFTSAEIRKLAE